MGPWTDAVNRIWVAALMLSRLAAKNLWGRLWAAAYPSKVLHQNATIIRDIPPGQCRKHF